MATKRIEIYDINSLLNKNFEGHIKLIYDNRGNVNSKIC